LVHSRDYRLHSERENGRQHSSTSVVFQIKE
jgi:hypothetical protein